MEAATAAGNTELREALMPAFEKVMTKSERKKRAKELKARKAAAAAGGGGSGGSAKASAAADKGGKKGDKKAGKNSTSCAVMDSATQAALDKVNSIGEQVRAVKSDGGDIKVVLAELGAAKKTLEGLVRPQMEAATAAGNTELREALMPAFEKVMTKSERKKRAKE